MEHRWMLGLAVAGLLAACSSDPAASPSPCADIAGNYKVTATISSNTCPPSLAGGTQDTVSFTKSHGDAWILVLPGIPGGCPGTLDAKSCRFVSNCDQKGADGSTLATLAIDYTFSAGGYTGSSITGVRPPTVPTPCEVTVQDKGTHL